MSASERLKDIDLFVCVANAGSFNAAAERLNLTPLPSARASRA